MPSLVLRYWIQSWWLQSVGQTAINHSHHTIGASDCLYHSRVTTDSRHWMSFWQGREWFLKQGACLSFNHQAPRVEGGERHQPEPSVSVQGTNPTAAPEMTWTPTGNQAQSALGSAHCSICMLWGFQPFHWKTRLFPGPRHRALEATVQKAVNITSNGIHQFASTWSIFFFTKAFLWFWLGAVARPEPQKLAGPACTETHNWNVTSARLLEQPLDDRKALVNLLAN